MGHRRTGSPLRGSGAWADLTFESLVPIRDKEVREGGRGEELTRTHITRILHTPASHACVTRHTRHTPAVDCPPRTHPQASQRPVTPRPVTYARATPPGRLYADSTRSPPPPPAPHQALSTKRQASPSLMPCAPCARALAPVSPCVRVGTLTWHFGAHATVLSCLECNATEPGGRRRGVHPCQRPVGLGE